MTKQKSRNLWQEGVRKDRQRWKRRGRKERKRKENRRRREKVREEALVYRSRGNNSSRKITILQFSHHNLGEEIQSVLRT